MVLGRGWRWQLVLPLCLALFPGSLLAQGINQSEPLTVRPRESLTTIQRSFALPKWGEATVFDRKRQPLPDATGFWSAGPRISGCPSRSDHPAGQPCLCLCLAGKIGRAHV